MGEHTKGPWKSDGEIVGWRNGALRAVRVTYRKSPGLHSPVAMCDSRVGEDEAIANAALIARAPDMAEELERQKDLIVTYERDRTKHLRSIEGANTDLAELGESLGEEIERLNATLQSRDHALSEDAELLDEAAGEYRKVQAQRDELLEAAQEVVDVVGGGVAIDESAKPSPTLKRLRAAIAKATP